MSWVEKECYATFDFYDEDLSIVAHFFVPLYDRELLLEVHDAIADTIASYVYDYVEDYESNYGCFGASCEVRLFITADSREKYEALKRFFERLGEKFDSVCENDKVFPVVEEIVLKAAKDDVRRLLEG